MYTITGIKETKKTCNGIPIEKSWNCVSTDKKNIISTIFFALELKLKKYEVTIEKV